MTIKTFSNKGASNLNLDEEVAMLDNLELHSRTYMSVRLLLAASLYSRECWKIETESKVDLALNDSLFSIGALMLSFSAIESSINEFYQNIADGCDEKKWAPIFSQDEIIKVVKYWERAKKNDTLEKFQTILKIANKVTFTDSKDILASFEKFKVLREIRHALYHYIPESSNKLNSHKEIERKLKKYKIPINPFYDGPANTFFPDKCFGHGLAEWSIGASIDFVEDFYQKLGMHPRFDKHQEKLATR